MPCAATKAYNIDHAVERTTHLSTLHASLDSTPPPRSISHHRPLQVPSLLHETARPKCTRDARRQVDKVGLRRPMMSGRTAAPLGLGGSMYSSAQLSPRAPRRTGRWAALRHNIGWVGNVTQDENSLSFASAMILGYARCSLVMLRRDPAERTGTDNSIACVCLRPQVA